MFPTFTKFFLAIFLLFSIGIANSNAEEKNETPPEKYSDKSESDRTKTSPKTFSKTEEGWQLPLNSTLKITGYKSVTVELNKTKYLDRHYGGSSGTSGGGLNVGLGGSSSIGYGSAPRASGLNIRQKLQLGLHGRVGEHINIEVDYSDSNSSSASGSSSLVGAKDEKIRVWYEGKENNIFKRVAFGDLTLNLPNTRFLKINRNLFGLEAIAELGNFKFTTFASQSKGISDRQVFRGESKKAGSGRGVQIADTNFLSGRYYLIQVGEDGEINNSYLPIEPGSEKIYIDDKVASNNQGGHSTADGYFNLQYSGQDYNIDYNTGEIEFLNQIARSYKMIAAYNYKGKNSKNSGGAIGNPTDPFAEDVTIGYVVLKDSNQNGSEARHVYNLGNRYIDPNDFQLSIFKQGGGESFETAEGEIPYVQIFGLDEDGDGNVDPQFIDFDRGLLKFPSFRPFQLHQENRFYEYRNELDNETIYSENISSKSQIYSIQAEYSYRSDSYRLGLFLMPKSETVRVNGEKMQRDIDYMIIYEVGTLRFFRKLDQYDEIEVEFERTPFGGALQNTVAGVWIEYGKGKGKSEKNSSRSSSGTNIGGRSRRGNSDAAESSFIPSFSENFKLSTGYILNTGRKPSAPPEAYQTPSRLQALNINTSFGHNFELAKLLNPLPLIELKTFPLSVNLSGEAAFSHNNPNSVDLAIIDSMESTKDLISLPTFKRSWHNSSAPIDINPNFGRVIFRRASDNFSGNSDGDEQENYVSDHYIRSTEINPLARLTDETLVMEIGYNFSDSTGHWGGISHGISTEGLNLYEHQRLQFWLKSSGNREVTLHIELGRISEDSDNDNRLDSEDLPFDLEDVNGDDRTDILDLELENLPEKYKYSANGTLDAGEDLGWRYNFSVDNFVDIGKDNKTLDTEDLDGDGELNQINVYTELNIPLDNIPDEWIQKNNGNSADEWIFLSIPLENQDALRFVQHARIWLERNYLDRTAGKLELAEIEIVGNRWENGIIAKDDQFTAESANPLTDESFEVGAKDNHNFDRYSSAYETSLKEHDLFKKLHPVTDATYATTTQLEQSLTLNYRLNDGSLGLTSRRLRGASQSNGQDFSKHRKLRFWLYGDGNETTFVLMLAPTVRASYQSSNDPFSDGNDYDRNIFDELTSFYQYETLIDFVGWKLIEIDLTDEVRNEYVGLSEDKIPESEGADGHPDRFSVHVGNPTGSNISNLTIEKIGGILLGVRNDTGSDRSGEIWVNEIHLGEAVIQSGWAKRGNISIGFGELLNIRGGMAGQDRTFESSTGSTGRQSRRSGGYSTTNSDYDITTELKIFKWMPIKYSLRHRDTQSDNRTSRSGSSQSDNRDLSVQLKVDKFPSIGLGHNHQELWNERQGLQLSDLYTGNFRYNFGRKVDLNFQYRHENVDADDNPEFTGNRDEKLNSGSVSIKLQPFNSFSVSPKYDFRHELERRSAVAKTDDDDDDDDDESRKFKITLREHKISLSPRISRDLFGFRPTFSDKMSLRENWSATTKSASVSANFQFGVGVRPKDWFRSFLSGNSNDDKFFKRVLRSLSLNGSMNYNASNSFRQLSMETSTMEVLRISSDDERVNQSKTGKKYKLQTSATPWKWFRLSANFSIGSNFTKSSSSTSLTETKAYDGSFKFFNKVDLRYRFDERVQSNASAKISDSRTFEPSIGWNYIFKGGTKADFNFRLTRKVQNRAGVESSSLNIKPNISLNYRLKTEGKAVKLPFIGGEPIKLKRDLSLTNTFSTTIRREKLGANRENRSERYELNSRGRYNLSKHLTSNFNFGLSYNRDRVRSDQDYFSITSSVTIRGNFN